MSQISGLGYETGNVTITIDALENASDETKFYVAKFGPQFQANKFDSGDTLKVVSVRAGWIGSFPKNEILIQELPGSVPIGYFASRI